MRRERLLFKWDATTFRAPVNLKCSRKPTETVNPIRRIVAIAKCKSLKQMKAKTERPCLLFSARSAPSASCLSTGGSNKLN